VPTDPSGTPFQYDAATGEVRLSPESTVRYLKVPYDYKAGFVEKLERAYSAAPP
jgi:hypothetical protein